MAEEPRVIDTVKLESPQTVDLKDGKGSVLISMMGRSAKYVLKGNEGEETPEIGKQYFLVPAPARVYECENVALMIPSSKTPPGPSHYSGVYCLVGTYPKE